jgi:hypothetical protein
MQRVSFIKKTLKLLLEIQASDAHCLAARKIRVFLEEAETFIPNYLPDDCQELFGIEAICVSEKYQGFVLYYIIAYF